MLGWEKQSIQNELFTVPAVFHSTDYIFFWVSLITPDLERATNCLFVGMVQTQHLLLESTQHLKKVTFGHY